MPVIAVINRKGGSGKSTLATHLAGYLARRGSAVMLGDVDKQQSTVPWLKRRAALALPGPAIVGWQVDPRNTLRAPPGVTHIVLDTPGGLQGFDLARLMLYTDAVLMPVCDSAFDRESAADTHAELRAHPRVSAGRCKLAAVGMRIDGRTNGEEALRAWADGLKLPFVGVLRSTQTYVRCIDRGLTVFDLPAPKAQADLDQWQPVLDWLQPVFDAAPALQPTRAPNQLPRAPKPAEPVQAWATEAEAPARNGQDRAAPAEPRAEAAERRPPVVRIDPLPAALERVADEGRFANLRRWLRRMRPA